MLAVLACILNSHIISAPLSVSRATEHCLLYVQALPRMKLMPGLNELCEWLDELSIPR